MEGFEETLTPAEKQMLDNSLSCSVAGPPEAVRDGMADFAARTQADELLITSHIYNHANRLRSFKIVAEVGRSALSTQTAATP